MSQRLLEAVSMPPAPRDEFREAFENYQNMKDEVARLTQENLNLRIENGSLVAENGILREQCERSDSDRVRLQAVSSTLTGQLLAINAVIADAMRLAVKNGVDAETTAAKQDEKKNLDEAGAEIRDIIERVSPEEPPVDTTGIPINRL